MPWVIAVLLVAVLAVSMAAVRKNGSVQQEIRTCLNETGDAQRLKTLLGKRGVRTLSTGAEADDARVRLCRMEHDEAAMKQALAEMNRHAAPVQLDYLWGVDRFYYALMRQDLDDLEKAFEFVSQVTDRNRKKKMERALDGMEALVDLLRAPRTEAKMTPLLNRLLGAFNTETGFSRVEQGWILEDLKAAGIRIVPAEE